MIHERETLSVEEAAKVLGVCRSTAYDLVRAGDIPALRLGRRILVPRAALDRLLGVDSEGGNARRAEAE